MMSLQTALEQASMTADEYLQRAVESVDAQFGDGYAKQHPELVGAVMRTAVNDFAAMVALGLVSTTMD